MNNSGFSQIDNATKIRNLTDVIDKRCKGFIKPDVINSIVNRLDFRKQLKIDVVNKDVLMRQAVLSTETTVIDGCVCNVFIQWCRCLLGSIEFGRHDIVIDNGAVAVTHNSKPRIIAAPLIVLIEEQNLGDIEVASSRLIIYL